MATENGWEPSPRIEPGSSLLVWKTVPGTNVTLQVRNDDAGKIMLAYAADYNAFIETLRDADSACYTPTNSVATSNHLNATAMDLNWNSHPFQIADAGFTPQMIAKMRDLLAFYDGVMFWANDWDSPKDAMHHQMDYGSYGKTAGFVKAKIRSDGFSTYKRGPLAGNSTPPAVPDKPVEVGFDRNKAITVLYDAVPVIDEDDAARLIDAVVVGLAAAQCNNVKRIAMYLAQCGHESDGFKTTTEYGTGQRYAPFIGRTWIQITWDYNYKAFGKWLSDKGIISDPDQFFKNPASLSDLKWAGLGPAWYMTVAQPRFNTFADAGNIEDCSKLINAPAWVGTSNRANGIQDRINRYNQAIGLGDRLLGLINTTTVDDSDDGEEVDKEQADRIEAKLDEVLAQLHGDWPQNGNDMKAALDLDKRKAAGDRLTLNDLLCWVKNHTSTHKNPTP